jgi:hypothetical protein
MDFPSDLLRAYTGTTKVVSTASDVQFVRFDDTRRL